MMDQHAEVAALRFAARRGIVEAGNLVANRLQACHETVACIRLPLLREPNAASMHLRSITEGRAYQKSSSGGKCSTTSLSLASVTCAPVSSEERAENLISLLPRLGAIHSGRFLNYDGKQLPW